MVVPSPATNAALSYLAFPVVHPTETMLNITLAAIIQPMVLVVVGKGLLLSMPLGGSGKLEAFTYKFCWHHAGNKRGCSCWQYAARNRAYLLLLGFAQIVRVSGKYSVLILDMTSGCHVP